MYAVLCCAVFAVCLLSLCVRMGGLDFCKASKVETGRDQAPISKASRQPFIYRQQNTIVRFLSAVPCTIDSSAKQMPRSLSHKTAPVHTALPSSSVHRPRFVATKLT